VSERRIDEPLGWLAHALVLVASAGALGATVEIASRHEPTAPLLAALGAMLLGCVGLLALVPRRSRLLAAQAEELRRREAILEATAFAAERLAGPGGIELGLDAALARLGEATGVSRVYLYRNGLDGAGRRTMSIIHEWTARGIAPTIQDPENQDHPYAEGFQHWERAMMDGRPVQTRRSEAGEIERRDMESEDVRSVLAVPVFVDGAWWGYIGFDDCERERRWTAAEVDALRAAAVLVGAAISSEGSSRAIREAERRYRTLVEHLPAAVYLDGLDEGATTLYISPAVTPMLGYTPEEWTADPDLFPRILHPEDREAVLAANVRHNETGEPFRMEYRMIAKDGRIVWVRDEAVIVRDERGRPLYSQGFLLDITASKLAEERISYLSYHDQLTGLANHAMFSEVATLALARARRNDLALAVLFLDLDDFRLVNDSLGPACGDELLRQVAERLASCVRDTDTVARRGGDEFLVLLPDLERGSVGEMSGPLMHAETVAARIRERLAEPFAVGGTEVFVSASIGIAVGPQEADDAAALLLTAEEAMVRSKRSGPGGVESAAVRSAEAQTKLAFATKLRKAVDRREFHLHYQPVVELATGRVVGVEALIRWRAPDGETIPPNEFIPLAEELGLIEQIGDWVVEELVRQEAEWEAAGIELELGFNLSPRQFFQADLADRLLAQLATRSVDPRRVVVEITESSAMRDPERARAILTDLRRRGLRLAMDDFGTGYSSLSRLRELPIDVLKIDRSFVREIDRDPQAVRIVAAFIQLGLGLGMRTLAEGIETEDERRLLVELGCELGQGYRFCRPLPPEELTARISSGELVLAGA
jgi:diguanylate cyclase (GGDEF)-like protein/PAS domain S-box-containing protein